MRQLNFANFGVFFSFNLIIKSTRNVQNTKYILKKKNISKSQWTGMLLFHKFPKFMALKRLKLYFQWPSCAIVFSSMHMIDLLTINHNFERYWIIYSSILSNGAWHSAYYYIIIILEENLTRLRWRTWVVKLQQEYSCLVSFSVTFFSGFWFDKLTPLARFNTLKIRGIYHINLLPSPKFNK